MPRLGRGASRQDEGFSCSTGRQLATRYVRTHEPARLLDLQPPTLEKCRCHGSGPTFRKLGGRVIYAIGDLQNQAHRADPLRGSGVCVEVSAMPEHGMATIWDADVLIWATSQIVEAENLDFKTSRFLRFTPDELPTPIGRQTGARDYKLLKGACTPTGSTAASSTARSCWRSIRPTSSWPAASSAGYVASPTSLPAVGPKVGCPRSRTSPDVQKPHKSFLIPH